MENLTINRKDIEKTLSRIRDISAQLSSFNSKRIEKEPTQFSNLMGNVKAALNNINTSQIQADNMRTQYLEGNPNVSVSQVMMSTIKSKIALEGLIAVRNKLLESYREIMNMPV